MDKILAVSKKITTFALANAQRGDVSNHLFIVGIAQLVRVSP